MKIIGTLLLFFIYSASFSQQNHTVSFDQQLKQAFNGLKTENGTLFYTAFRGKALDDNPYNVDIRLFDDQFNILTEDRIAGGYGMSLQDVVGFKGGLIFYLREGDKGIVVRYNANGEKAWQKTIVKDKNRYTKVKLRSLGKEGIAVVHDHKAEDKGVLLEVRDQNWNVVWKKGAYPDKGKYRLIDVATRGDKAVVLMREKGGMFSGNSGIRVAAFSAGDQKLLYNSRVSDDLDNFHPGLVRAFADGSSVVVFHIKDDSREGDNLNFSKFKPDGALQYQKTLDYKTDKAALMPLKPYPVEGGYSRQKGLPYIKFHEAQKTDNGIKLIGESYYFNDRGREPSHTTSATGNALAERGSGPKVKTDAYVMDYVTFNLSNNGSVKNINRIKKPYKHIEYSGLYTHEPLYVGAKLKKYGFFGYGYESASNEVVTLGWHSNRKYVGFCKLTEDYEDILRRIYTTTWVTEPENWTGVNTTYRYTEPDHHGDDPSRHFSGVLPYGAGNKSVYFNFDEDKSELDINVYAKNKTQQKPKAGKRRIKDVLPDEFNGLHAYEDGGYYTWYFSEYGKDSTAYYIYLTLDNDLNTINRSLMKVPARAVPVAETQKADEHVIAFHDYDANDWYFYRFNNKGKELKSNFLEMVDFEGKSSVGSTRLTMQENGTLSVIQPFYNSKDGVSGFDIFKLSPDFEVSWSKSQYTADGYSRGLAAVCENSERIAVIEERKSTDNAELFHKALVYNLEDGSRIFEKELGSGERFFYPEYAQFGENNQLRIAGIYFNGDRFKKKNSDGLFVKAFAADGTEAFHKLTEWQGMQGKFDSEIDTEFMISGNTKVLIQDMLDTENGFAVIGELFRKSSGFTTMGALMGGNLKDRAFTVLDFLVFDFSDSGDLNGAYNIKKPEQSLDLGGLGSMKGLALSYKLRAMKVFSYRGTIGKENRKLVYELIPENSPKQVFERPLGKGQQTISASVEINVPEPPKEELPHPVQGLANFKKKMESKLDALDRKMDKSTKGTVRTLNFYNSIYDGIALFKPGEVVAYQYDPYTYSVFLEKKSLK